MSARDLFEEIRKAVVMETLLETRAVAKVVCLLPLSNQPGIGLSGTESNVAPSDFE